ncbi:MAG TPA: ATP-binding protein [Vicinamibacteria bacterium]|nr:ATP-binding protein [Vicinamibacteria bacterium]
MWALGRREPQKAPVAEPAAVSPGREPGGPPRTVAEDLLGTAPLARGVVGLIEDAPPGAALRVGVYGRSGEGKTTLLRFVEELALERSWTVSWFNPWAANSPESLWQAFASDVLAGAPPDLETGDHRRQLILVDDVDRLPAAVVPLLLAAVRDRLSAPGCHFVLAMDPVAVSRTLAGARPGWPDGQALLEKALDHEFRLAALTAGDRLRLVEAELSRAGLLPDRLLGPHLDCLPAKAATLQRLLRGLGRLGGVLRRHDPEEVYASPLLWLELMRSAAPATTAGVLGSTELLRRLAGAGGGADSRREALDTLAQLVAAEEPGRSGEPAAFLRAAEVLLERPRPLLGYWARVARGELPTVTPMEAQRLLASEGVASEMEEWLSRQAASVGASTAEVQRALVDLLIAMRQQHLVRAVEGELEEDLERGLAEAQRVLAGLRWLIVDGGGFRDAILSRAEFQRLLEHFVEWAPHAGHPSQRAARDCEREILFAAAGDVASVALEILDDLAVWDPARQPATPEGGALTGQVCDILREHVAPRVVDWFLRDDGLSSTGPTQRHLLFGPSSPLYREDGRAAFAEAAACAPTNATVQRNFVVFLSLLHAANRRGVTGVLREDAERLAGDGALMRLAWSAATSQPVQPRHRHRLKQVREGLGRQLGDLSDLPPPAWLDQPE